jgi:hypothetical protein
MSKQFRQLIFILIIISFNLPISSLAIPIAVVEAVQEAAAFQRESRQQPLKKGIELLRGDIITTGSDARVAIRFSDGSLARIGAHARVVIERLMPPPADKEEGGLTGVFEVLKGIFRFSTSRRVDVKINVGHVISAGVRGTDVYTHAKVDKDMVCLIEGKVKVQAGEVTEWLTQPKEGFIVPKGKAPLPINLIPEETFQKWLINSELKVQ